MSDVTLTPDQIISNFNVDETGTLYQYLAAVLRTSGVPGQLKDLYATALPEHRLIVAASLVRVMHEAPKLFASDSVIALEANKFFDASFAQAYKDYNVDARSQNHLKRQALEQAYVKALSAFEIYVGEWPTGDLLNTVKGAVHKAYNNSLVRLFVVPLLPDQFAKPSRLSEFIDSLRAYIDADEDERRDEVERVEIIYRQMSDDVKSVDSNILRSTVLPLIEALHDAFVTALAADPIYQAATLSLNFPDRRYPLENLGQRFDIFVEVENHGPGVAREVQISYERSGGNENAPLMLGTLPPGRYLIQLQDQVVESVNDALFVCTINWIDAKGAKSLDGIYGELLAQRSGVDWDALRYSDPYSTEPVANTREFVGRAEQIRPMLTKITGRVIPSHYVVGQKRVGKTSLIRTLKQEVSERAEADVFFLILEGGQYIAADAVATLKRLCQSIFRGLAKAYPGAKLEMPQDFGINLSDLDVVFDSIWDSYPDAKIVIALDEFDELPLPLFEKGALSRAFFLALRGLSGRQNLGFVLIGSEKLSLIISEQGEHVNKWHKVVLDYFSKDEHWNDYVALVRRPTEGQIDFTDDAVSALYDWTRGHPFFTKLICGRIVEELCNRRISFVSEHEVEVAAQRCSELEPSPPFQHFWDDGILAPPEEQSSVSLKRRKILLAAADLLRNAKQLTVDNLQRHPGLVNEGGSVRDEIQAFQRRKILTPLGDHLEFVVPLFKKWLMNAGSSEILTELPNPGAVLAKLRDDTALRVKSEELVGLTAGWTYRWKSVTPELARAWLEKFGGYADQRIAFKVLKAVKFYSLEGYREGLLKYYKGLSGRYARLRDPSKRKRADILISYVDGVGKSGAGFARLLSEAAGVYYDNVVERGELRGRLDSMEDVSAIILVDDFIGSGGTAVTGLRRLWEDIGNTVAERRIGLHFLAIVGYAPACDRVKRECDKLYDRFELSTLDTLTDADKLFSPASKVWDNEAERADARELMHRFGSQLDARSPLGFDDGQFVVSFDSNCPNNSLPVLWKTKTNWTPLFPRV